MRLEDRVVVVTGAGRNIGEAVARRAAAEGARVAVLDIDGAQAERVASELGAQRAGSCLGLRCDVSSGAEVAQAMKQIVQRLGGIHVLVNNVAITDRKPIFDLEEDEWDRVMGVCLKSVFLCSKHAAHHILGSDSNGSIINIGSTSGHRGRPDATAYSAAKAGVLNLTRCLAMQLAPRIRVNSVTPNKIGSPVGESELRTAGTVTNLRGRNGVPEDIASAVVFLASDEADFVTGAELVVDGGVLAGLH